MEARSPRALSVLIASRNRRRLLRRCLESLRAQTAAPQAFEVVVADDGSTDGTAEMVEAFDAPFDLRLLRLEKGGKYSAVNAAIDTAIGETCVVLDDDVIASSELVAAYLAAHREQPSTLGIGALVQQPPAKRDWYAHAFARGWNEHYEDLERRPATWADCYGANFSAPRSKLLAIGGFDTELTVAGDLEIGFRLEQAGCTPRFLAGARGVHDDQKRTRQMLMDADRQAAAHLEIAARHPSTAPQLLEWKGAASRRELRARRLLISVRFPARPLAALGALVPGAGRKMVWFHAVRRFAFWRSVRANVNRSRWLRLTCPHSAGPQREGASRDAR